MISIKLAPGCTTAPIVVTFNLLTMPCTGDFKSVRRTRSCADLIFSSRTARSPLRLGQVLVGLRAEGGGDIGDLGLSLGELASHFRRLPVETQHLDFGHDFLLVELAGEGEFTIEQLERSGEPS